MPPGFQARFNGKPLFEAFSEVEGGLGSYLAIRAWETSLMMEMGVTEEDYVKIPVRTRADYIVVKNIDKWISILQGHADMKKAQARVSAARGRK